MLMTFKALGLKEWTLTDDKLIVENKVIKLSNIDYVQLFFKPTRFTNGVIHIKVEGNEYQLAFPYKQRVEGAQAVDYLLKHYNSPKPKEFRMRCNVCGKIYCYNENDLQKNTKNLEKAREYDARSTLFALGGAELSKHANMNTSDRYRERIVDYSKCPNCHSNNVSPFDGGSIAATSSVNTSAVDEIKKYKELLDMGILTQEEFDAKKKQLLGL